MTTLSLTFLIGTLLSERAIAFTAFPPSFQRCLVVSFSTNQQYFYHLHPLHQSLNASSGRDQQWGKAMPRSKSSNIGPLKVSSTTPDRNQKRSMESEAEILDSSMEDNSILENINDNVGTIGLVSWLVSLCSFVLINNFVGPWPFELIDSIPEPTWLLVHYIGGMLFAGGIILTTCMEQLAVSSKDKSVLNFWFERVPLMDCAIVLPGLTMAMVAGVCSAVHRYHSLAISPVYIQTAFYTLAAFAMWWGLTDLSTQPKAASALQEWAAEESYDENGTDAAMVEEEKLPNIVYFRRFSNIVSCGFVLALYGIMTLKPGGFFFH